jgi:hypothetical protein
VTLPSFSLPTVAHDISNLLVIPAIKHQVILTGGLTLLSLAAFSARIRGGFAAKSRGGQRRFVQIFYVAARMPQSNGLAIRIALT